MFPLCTQHHIRHSHCSLVGMPHFLYVHNTPLSALSLVVLKCFSRNPPTYIHHDDCMLLISITRVLRKHKHAARLLVPTTVLLPFAPLSWWRKSTPLSMGDACLFRMYNVSISRFTPAGDEVVYIRNVWVTKNLWICIDLILSLWSKTHSSVKNSNIFNNESAE